LWEILYPSISRVVVQNLDFVSFSVRLHSVAAPSKSFKFMSCSARVALVTVKSSR